MNMKLVIVWIVAVVIFAGIGLFGMANQDLLVKQEELPSNPNTNPVSDKTSVVACNAKMSTSESSYSFTVDNETSTLLNVAITYRALAQNDTIYNSAINLSNQTISGVTTTVSGDSTNFVLIMNVNLQNYDATTLSNYQNDLNSLNAVVGNYSIDDYKGAINSMISSTGAVYNCN